MRKVVVVLHLLFLLVVSSAIAQELNARVEILAPKIPNNNKRVIDLLQKTIQDYLNNRSWIGLAISPEERINCSFVINITSWDGSKEYKADAQIYSSRPVFNTSYNSPVLAFRDKSFNFSYVEGEQLDFSNDQNLSSLGALLGYYAHVIIGMDQDTFRQYGGSSAFSIARNIVNYSQSSPHDGWRSMESTDNRYWLINNLTDRRYNAYRDFYFNYHLQGLDKLSADAMSTRNEMAKMVEKLKEVDRGNTGNVLTQVLFSAKSNEFVGVFNALPGNEKVRLFNELVNLDPFNTSKYEALR